jgi:hypothetical protein
MAPLTCTGFVAARWAGTLTELQHSAGRWSWRAFDARASGLTRTDRPGLAVSAGVAPRVAAGSPRARAVLARTMPFPTMSWRWPCAGTSAPACAPLMSSSGSPSVVSLLIAAPSTAGSSASSQWLGTPPGPIGDKAAPSGAALRRPSVCMGAGYLSTARSTRMGRAMLPTFRSGGTPRPRNHSSSMRSTRRA